MTKNILYKEQLSRMQYSVLVSTKIATKNKAYTKTHDVRKILRKNNCETKSNLGHYLFSLSDVHGLLDVHKGRCLNSGLLENRWSVNKNGNEFIKRNIHTQSQPS